MRQTVESALQKREILSFDRGWRFCQGDPDGAESVEFDDCGWRVLDVPHDWSIEGPFDSDMENGGTQGYLPRGGVGWYRKSFRLEPAWSGKKVIIRFDGVHHYSEVWINGVRLGQRPYGYVPFHYDLTPYVKDGENVIAVRVDNTSPLMDRWYSGSGIYRHVRLLVTGPVHVDIRGTCVTTPQIAPENALVRIRTDIVNDRDREAHCTVVSVVRDRDGNEVGRHEQWCNIGAHGRDSTEQEIRVANPQLWSPDSPDLYELYTSVYHEGDFVDDCVTPFGIRDVVFDNERGLLLNGNPVKLKGVCLHHDLGCLGAAFHEQAMERRLRVLKGMGCNAIRFSHNPMAQELLELCDRMGFMVIDEAFDKWKSLSYEPMFESWWKADLEAMVLRDRNHPCVILWSVGNEVEKQGSPEMLDMLEMLVNHVRELDPTRPVTCAFEPHNWPRSLFHGPIEDKVGVMRKLAEKVDILALNYQEQWYEHYREAIPDKLIVGAESFPYFRGRGNVLKAFDPMNPWFDVERHDYVIGQFVWPGIDYLGEASYPYKGWQAGLIDTCGFRKPVSYFHESVWSDKPMVRIAVVDETLNMSVASRWSAHWHWPKMISGWTFPRENQLYQLVTFTNCESVELKLNDESLGEKRLDEFPNRIMTWYVPYASGTIEAIGKTNGKVCAVHRLETAGEPRRLVLTTDRAEINANGTDLAHVEVTVTDEKGIPVPAAEVPVTFEVAGPGKVIGVDSGNLASDEPFKGSGRTTYFGRALAIVQSDGGSGTIELKAVSGGLEPGTAVIQTR